MKDISPDIIKNLKAFAFDVDGVLFPNENWWFSDGTYARRRSLYDGQGISLLRALGFKIVFITSAKGEMAKPITNLIEKWNELPSSKSEKNPSGWEHVDLHTNQSSASKKVTLAEWLTERSINPNECGAMGDDLVDIQMLESVAFSVAPNQAEAVVRERCHFVSERNGGEGAIRDLANYILKIRGVDPTTLEFQ